MKKPTSRGNRRKRFTHIYPVRHWNILTTLVKYDFRQILSVYRHWKQWKIWKHGRLQKLIHNFSEWCPSYWLQIVELGIYNEVLTWLNQNIQIDAQIRWNWANGCFQGVQFSSNPCKNQKFLGIFIILVVEINHTQIFGR